MIEDYSVTYQQEVIDLFNDAVDDFRSEYGSQEAHKVFQISIWTDPGAIVSSINFETKQHAVEKLERQEARFRELGFEPQAKNIKARGYVVNPADFQYTNFDQFQHKELKTLMAKERVERDIVEEYIEKNLLIVFDRIIADNLLQNLPKEDHIWFGTSSPRDWYDHVRKISCDRG